MFAIEYSADDVVKILGAVVATLMALGGIAVNVIVALRTGRKVDENTKITQAAAGAVAEVARKASVIEGHVNSQSSTSAAEIAGLREQVSLMHDLLAQSQTVSVQLAAASAPIPNGIPVVERRVRESDKDPK